MPPHDMAIGDLESGETFSFDFLVTVDAADGPRVNVAAVASDTYDDNLDNNEAEAATDAVAADLELVKDVIPVTAAPEDIVEWSITVSNKGPDDATGVVVEDILPAGVAYTSDASGGSFDPITGQWTIGDIASSNGASSNSR